MMPNSLQTEEMRTLIEENGKEFLRWLAQYMVMKRVSIEQNFQPLYNNFLTAIADKQLEKACKDETFRNIRVIRSSLLLTYLCKLVLLLLLAISAYQLLNE